MTHLQQPRRLYTHYRKVYLTFRTRYTSYTNKHDENKMWHCWEEWAIFAGLKSRGHKWFGYEDLYHGGHIAQMVIIAGLVFGWLYSCDAQPMEMQDDNDA